MSVTEVLEKDNVFLSAFHRLERESSADTPPWVHPLRKAALAHFVEIGFPTTRQEEWRFTDVSPLVEVPFEPAPCPSRLPSPRQLEEAASLASTSRRIVFVNGHYAHDLSSTGPAPGGVVLMSLAEALRSRGELVRPHLARHAAYRDHAFVALNTAFLDDGALVHLPPGSVVREPIHLIHAWTETDRNLVTHPRNLVVAENNAETQIVETYLGLGENTYFTNAVTEIVLAPGASVDHYKLQREGPNAFHMGTVDVHQQRDSTFVSHLISLGGSLARNETNALLDGEGCQCTLDGLYMARRRQLLDSRTRIDHAKPNCHSRELYKGILDDRAKAVFNGKIVVHQDAQKTNAQQTNRALLLSDNATLNTKPQLEIFADDVKCTHGATVGQLEEEAMFYLRSRGISHQLARNLLIYAFANDVLLGIRPGTIRAELERILLAARGLPNDTAAGEIP